MPASRNSEYLFTCCQVGAEAALQSELLRNRIRVRVAFSRPGFLTFKCTGENFFITPEYALDSVFARDFGAAFQDYSGTDLEVARQICAFAHSVAGRERLRLHVWERDRYAPGGEPPGYSQGGNAERLERLITKDPLFLGGDMALVGELVLSVIGIESNSWWTGLHRHSTAHSPFAGGGARVEPPADAPGGAYSILEESVLRFGPVFSNEDVALVIGGAPGGSSWPLLQRGLSVVALESAEMDPRVIAHPKFRQTGRQEDAQKPAEPPPSAQWLILDLNAPTAGALAIAAKLSARYKDTLLGAFLILGFGEWSNAAETAALLDRVRAMGFSIVRSAHLPSCRAEVVAYGLTKRGLTREKRP